MLEKALKFIFAKAEEKKDNVEFVEDFGCKYVLDKNVGRLSLHCPPGMDTIEIFTLSGIVDFLSINIDKFNISDFFIRVANPKYVEILSKLKEGYLVRSVPLRAHYDGEGTPYHKEFSYFNFASMLYEYFVHTKELKELIAKLNGITSVKDTQFTNNGVEMMIQRRNGITLVGNETFDPVVTLKPYRTFHDVEQPESKFLIKINERDGIPYFSIVPVDGGMWERRAVSAIKEWLDCNLKMKGISISVIA